MDKIIISNLQADAVIGTCEHEQRRRQRLSLDIELATDATAAASTDALADALDYVAITETLADLIQQSNFALIESLAEACAQALQRKFGVTWLKLTIHKPGALPGTTNVAVQIERQR